MTNISCKKLKPLKLLASYNKALYFRYNKCYILRYNL